MKTNFAFPRLPHLPIRKYKGRRKKKTFFAPFSRPSANLANQTNLRGIEYTGNLAAGRRVSPRTCTRRQSLPLPRPTRWQAAGRRAPSGQKTVAGNHGGLPFRHVVKKVGRAGSDRQPARPYFPIASSRRYDSSGYLASFSGTWSTARSAQWRSAYKARYLPSPDGRYQRIICLASPSFAP